MRKMKNRFWKTGILLIGISLLLSNCEKDEIPENINEKLEIENSNLRINKISLKQLQQLKNLENPIKHVLKNFDINVSKKGIISKSSIVANDGSFTILTDEILQVETDSTKTYTFRIETPTDTKSSFENFVIDFPNENYYYFYIYKYVFDENSTEDFPYIMTRLKVNENLLSFTSLNNLNARGTTCGSSITMVVVDVEYTCSCCGRNEIHPTCPSGYDERQIYAPIITYQGDCGTTDEAIYPDNNNETTDNCDTCGSNGTTQGTGDSSSTTGVLLSFEQLIFQNFVKYDLNIAEKSWINDIENLDYKNQIYNFLNNNLNDSELDYTIEAKDFAKSAFEFLTVNPQFNFIQYENWFNGSFDGIDFTYDTSYWENPNLTFPQQDLPSWDDFYNAYPRTLNGEWLKGADNVFSYVGGDVYQARLDYPNSTTNTCALKVSIALNGAGISIPQITTSNNSQGTTKGADGKYYFLNARALNMWMRKTFGIRPSNPNHYHYTSTDGGINGRNFPNLLNGKKGIYSLISSDPNWASGHSDILLSDTTCAAGCHFGDAPIEYIDIWVLK